MTTSIQILINTTASLVGYLLISYALFGQLIYLRIVSISLVASIVGGVYVVNLLQTSIFSSIFVVIIIGGALGLLGGLIHNRIGYKKRAIGLLASIGYVQFVRGLIEVFTGGGIQTFSLQISSPLPPNFYGNKPSWLFYGIIIIIIVGLGVWYLYRKTFLGIRGRAVGDDSELFSMLGFDRRYIELSIQSLGGSIAALAGVFLAFDSGIRPDLGFSLLLKVFAILLVAKENLWLIPICAIILALVENISGFYLGGQLSQAITLGIMVCIIFGKTLLIDNRISGKLFAFTKTISKNS